MQPLHLKKPICNCNKKYYQGNSSIVSCLKNDHIAFEIIFIFDSHSIHKESTSSEERDPDILERNVALEGQIITATLNALRTSILCRSNKILS